MANYEAPVVEILRFDTNEQWNDVVASPWQGVASAPDKYSDM